MGSLLAERLSELISENQGVKEADVPLKSELRIREAESKGTKVEGRMLRSGRDNGYIRC